MAETGIVIATRNRRRSLPRTLRKIEALPERPPTVVVDNASGDGTPDLVAERFPWVDLVALRRNRGAAARNVGVERVGTDFVAFSDDDSWWEPGALERAAALFRDHPTLGLLAARILVGDERRLDPISDLMDGPSAPALPGPRVDGFLACGAVVRRDAFLEVGGFCERFLIGAEETLVAIDMRAAGWDLCYASGVTAVHEPDSSCRGDRQWLSARNALWTSWMLRPTRQALDDTVALAALAASDSGSRRALLSAARGLPWALRCRRQASNGSGVRAIAAG